MSEEKPEGWGEDHLERWRDALLLERFLIGRVDERRRLKRPACYVLNIDAGWGQGKSFFLERFRNRLVSAGYRVALINAWTNDFADDPLIPVASAIEDGLAETIGKKSSRDLLKVAGEFAAVAGKHVGLNLVTRLVGKDGAEIVERVGENAAKGVADALEEGVKMSSDKVGQRLLKRFEEAQKSVTKFKKHLSDLAQKKDAQRPVFILVDELDRCRPNYAIELLERIKHFFDVDDVVFVVATDTSQLRHAVGAVYGSGFDGQGYLLRFFDRTYRFREPDIAALVRHLFTSHDIDSKKLAVLPGTDVVKFFTHTVWAFALSLREVERAFDLLNTATTVWDRPIPLQAGFLLPLIAVFLKRPTHEFDGLARADETTVADVLKIINHGQPLVYTSSPRAWDQNKEDVPFSEILRAYAQYMKVEETELVRMEELGFRSWVKREIVSELNFRGNYKHDGEERRSFLFEYGDLLQSAGRLLPARR